MGRLKDRMRMDMELKNLSRRTIKTYLHWVERFTIHYGKSPEKLGDEEIRGYLHYLLKEKKASQAAMNQAYSALKFFYEKTLHREWNSTKIPRSKIPKKLPVVLSQDEILRIFSATRTLKHLTAFMIIYSGGLRVGELVKLRVTDIDRERMSIRIRQGKGAKDRYTILGERTLEVIQKYWHSYQPQDWLFPGEKKGNYLSVSSIQRGFSGALRRAGISKRASVHTLRHSFATHLLEQGVDLYYIQRLLGHSSQKTTSVYIHVARKNITQIKSPIDFLDNDEDPKL
jgi:integrase/recombinase XerD